MNPFTPNILTRIGISAYAAFTALANPARQDMVAALGETTGLKALERIRDEMLLDPTGRRILREKPIVHSSIIDFEKLISLPTNTFGYQFADFMAKNDISVDTRMDIRYIGDPELAYVMTRYRQVHDYWHTLVELPITIEAEIGLKWFEFFQTGLPMTALSALFGPLNITPQQREILYSVYVPWAIHCAQSSSSLMNVMYEDHFEKDFLEFKKELGISKIPLE